MKLNSVVAGVLLAVLAVLPVRAETLDVSTVTCGQLVEAIDSGNRDDKFGMGVILYWIAGYSGTEEQATIIDFDSLHKDFDKITARCREQKNVGVLTIAQSFLGENATPAGKDAIDIATIPCGSVLETDKKDEEGLGLILMWLEGYHAAVNEDKVFNSETFDENMKSIGEYCAENPNVGFFTAAEKHMTVEE